ncbi:MAG: 2-succinyl-5-enolpyruvyl-6-hydroxy-3-cyclohexene-1-carboxylate synthase [Chlamydiae bacterium]|nr:2-succinyl-5-enolpyruvyl-6-hydroxy-3-cyclohexene-1-carboxylate synthase [Chlamydiota bacterium]
MNRARQNEIWGKTLIEELIQQGVDYFCLSPGNRAAPLALAVANHPKARCFVHYDERGSAFHALGYAKATGKPVCLIVTSGTALGNLMPAVMEAYHSRIPLILLTADRPAELRDTMANQTTDQLKFFGEFTRYFFDLPSPQEGLPERFLGTTIAQLVSRSLFPVQGPVQLNCPFPEPFFEEPGQAIPISAEPIFYTHPELTLSRDHAKEWADRLSSYEKGVIAIGSMQNPDHTAIESLAKKLGWPIIADITSSYRCHPSQHTIPYAHHLLKSLPDLRPDVILHLGDQCVSKPFLQWLGGCPLIHVSDHPMRNDPMHLVTDRVIASANIFCEQLSLLVKEKKHTWLDHWKELAANAKRAIDPFFADPKEMSEPQVIKTLEAFTSEKTALFFANSMPIRDADMFFYPTGASGPVFANRGLSGIDGNIATCAGIAQVMPLIAVMGDQTFLHDLNSLVQWKKVSHPIQLILINNGGGGIFSFVDVGRKKEILDPYFANAHQMTFEKAAALFDLPYTLATTPDELKMELQEGKTGIIEVQTNREENLALHRSIDNAVKETLCGSFSTAF